jgi:hypothetical protein
MIAIVAILVPSGESVIRETIRTFQVPATGLMATSDMLILWSVLCRACPTIPDSTIWPAQICFP